MSNDEDARPGVALTSRHLLRDGVPVVPVSGEIHYSRVPRHRWRQRLRQMRSGGVTVITTYVFWLHHEERRGSPRFDGNLDVGAFLDLCAAEGFDVVLRIGPWCHGEARNGGFPDWVQRAPVRHRSDDPAYLELVRDWFGKLAPAVGARRLLGIQLENELYDQPGHIVTLKRLARSAGLSAPLWTATAWGGAELPGGEVLPVYGGYGDGFWVDADAPWDPTFRDHYFFSHVWDDPGVGADLRPPGSRPRTAAPSVEFPPVTCELGGGMATAYHRRPLPVARDIAAVAHCKIGNGSAWQGYYMYAGGTNPTGDYGMQESHATGYPNDLPPLGYDFHAPIGEAGLLAASHAELRWQHAFLAAFGAALAGMPSSLPVLMPQGVEDVRTLRCALRSSGESGFLFVAWHQPHVPLPACRGARFRVSLDRAEIVFPGRPVDVPAGTLARWPVALTAGGVRVDWATASALTLLPGAVPTLVLLAEEGIPVSYGAGGAEFPAEPGLSPIRLGAEGGELDLLILPASVGSSVWVCEPGPERRLVLSEEELTWGPDGRIWATGPGVRVYDPARRAFAELPMELDGLAESAVAELDDPAESAVAELDDPAAAPEAGLRVVVEPVLLRGAGSAVPVAYGKFDGRQSAPSPETFDELAAVYRVPLPSGDSSLDVHLLISWAGDVGQLRVDGRTVTDRFWDGSEWVVNLRDAGVRAGSEVTLHLLPLASGSPVALPREARARLAAADGQLLAIDSLRLVGRATWRELR
jgi:hypothetical protein